MRVMEKLLHSYEFHFSQPISRLKLKLCRIFTKIYFRKANKAKWRNFSSYITGCMIRSTGAETGRQSWGSGTEGLHWLENHQNSGLFLRQAWSWTSPKNKAKLGNNLTSLYIFKATNKNLPYLPQKYVLVIIIIAVRCIIVVVNIFWRKLMGLFNYEELQLKYLFWILSCKVKCYSVWLTTLFMYAIHLYNGELIHG